MFPDITHWTRTADLLALAPLPVEMKQEEEDERQIRNLKKQGDAYGFNTSELLQQAIAYGRSTAAKEGK